MDPSHSFEGEQDRVLVNAALNWLNKLIPWSLGIPVFFQDDLWISEECWPTEVWHLDGSEERENVTVVVSPVELFGQTRNKMFGGSSEDCWQRKGGTENLKSDQGGMKRPRTHLKTWSFIFKLKSAEETEKTPPGGLPLISVGNVKQSWPTPEQLTQNQPLTPAVWSICNSNLGIAMKTTFCFGCRQEFI